MNKPTYKKPRCAIQIAACVVGLVVGLIGYPIFSNPFWGITGFANKELFATSEEPGVLILGVEPGSPAARAGIQTRDRIVSYNGQKVDMANFSKLAAAIETGQRIVFEGKREGNELKLDFQGEQRTFEGVVVFDWQFVSTPICLALVILLIATQPLAPVPIWRAIVVIVAGLGIVVPVVLVDLLNWIPWTILWRTKAISNSPPALAHFAATITILTVGLVLAFSGAFDIRSRYLRSPSPPN
jgi:hypothetical protein